MLREPPQKIGLMLDTRLRRGIFEFGQSIGAETISDSVRTLIIAGLERTANVESTLLKSGYRAGVNMGLSLVKERLMDVINEKMTQIDATDDLTAE